MRLVVSVDTVGGGWSPVMHLARGLAGAGFDVSLALLGPAPAPTRQAELDAAGLRWFSAHDVGARQATGFADLQAAGQALSRLSNVTGVDAVVLHHPALAGFLPFDAPVIVTPDSRDIVVSGRQQAAAGHEWRARLLRAGYQKAAAVVAPTHADAMDIVDAHRLRLPPRVIRRGFSAFAADAPPVDLAPYALAIRSAGDGRENSATLNEAAFLCDTPLMLAGVSAGAAPDAGHLWALGPLPPGQVQRWIAGASLFVSAATGDTDGEAVWRAAQAGLPLVLADAPDYRELWDGAAVFANAGDEVALGRAITTLMADADRRATLGAAARDRASDYSLDHYVQAWADFIRDVAAAAAHPHAA